MANINDYLYIIKELKNIINDLQYLVSPNMDIDDLHKNIISFNDNINLIKYNLKKTKRVLKIKKHKKKKK